MQRKVLDALASGEISLWKHLNQKEDNQLCRTDCAQPWRFHCTQFFLLQFLLLNSMPRNVQSHLCMQVLRLMNLTFTGSRSFTLHQLTQLCEKESWIDVPMKPQRSLSDSWCITWGEEVYLHWRELHVVKAANQAKICFMSALTVRKRPKQNWSVVATTETLLQFSTVTVNTWSMLVTPSLVGFLKSFKQALTRSVSSANILTHVFLRTNQNERML